MDSLFIITIDKYKQIYEKYIKYAKERNDNSLYAYYQLGMMHNKGLYVKKDNIIALRLLGKFLKEIHENSRFYNILHKVLYYIGKIYLEEKDVKNDDQALKFLKKAKEKGSQEASEMLLQICGKEIEISDLPNEILVIIFSKMNNKSLFESFFVSNHWKNLIAYHFFDRINSRSFYSCYTLPINIMRRYRNDLDWKNISFHQKLKIKYMKEFEDKICWNEVPIRMDIMRNFKNKLNWKNISRFRTLREIHIKEFQNEVDWELISEHKKLSEDFIREFQHKVNWKNISIFQKLSEDFIREFKDRVDWHYISRNLVARTKLREDFIREFQDDVDWERISIFGTISSSCQLSEDFIREFQHKLNWEHISKYNLLSENFIREFQHKLNWIYISKRNLSEKFRKEFEDKIRLSNTISFVTLFAIFHE